MKKLILASALIAIFASSCKKNKPDVPAPPPSPYTTSTANSVWYYQNTDTSGTPDITNDTTKSTNRDTTVSSIVYHVYTNTALGDNEYRKVNAVNATDNDYVQLFNTDFDGTTPVYAPYIYLKDYLAVNGSWTQNFTVKINGTSAPASITNTIMEKGISRTVNGQAYTDVVHVQSVLNTSFTINFPPFPPIPVTVTRTEQLYYARRFGLIESSTIQTINAPGLPGFPQTNATSSKLSSAVLL